MGADFDSLLITLKLAFVTTILLVLVSVPLAWWLVTTNSRIKIFLNSFLNLPLVLPPTVLGFYLLVLLGPEGPVGKLTNYLGLENLPFTFSGLVIGSFIYSFPFVIQPIQSSFQSIGSRPFEIAATLRASPLDRFLTIALPMAKPGIITAAILGFAHTLGEFGVVMMLGGSIPGKTKVISIAIFEHVESMELSQAHRLSFVMLLFSFLILFILQLRQNRQISDRQNYFF